MEETQNAPAEQTQATTAQTTEPVRDAEAVLKKNYELLEENRRLKEIARRAEGIDLEQARQAMDAQRKAEEERLVKAGEYEKILEQRAKAYEERIENERRERSRIESTLKQEKLALTLIEKGVLPDRVQYLVKELADQVELHTGETGFVLRKKDGIGDAVEFEALVENVKARSPFFFAAQIASGTGGSGSVGSTGTSTRKWSDLSITEKADAIREAGGDTATAQKKYQ
jgi:hypothetical protein